MAYYIQNGINITLITLKYSPENINTNHLTVFTKKIRNIVIQKILVTIFQMIQFRT